MGNSQTKEARQTASLPSPRLATQSTASTAAASRNDGAVDPSTSERPFPPSHPSGRRASRPDLSFFGIGGGNNDRDLSSLEARRETKQEREARKLERERAARVKERERSIKEENVDGGYLVTQGVYVGPEDYNKAIVRRLMIERRLAPFWRGLNEFSESWAEHQLMAAARGMSIPPADEVPLELEYQGKPDSSIDLPASEQSLEGATVPMDVRRQSQSSSGPSSLFSSSHLQMSPQGSPTAAPVLRTRAKTLASLTTSSKPHFQADMAPQELQLPKEPTINGQPIEVFLYKDPSECPICFLFYPPYLNTTRCCDQSICSECFVQIKRPDPHPPEHEQPDPNATPLSEAEREAAAEGQLVSEAATCPFCKQPEFGITYSPPPFRRGLTYGGSSQPLGASVAMSSQTSLSSTATLRSLSRRRGASLSATDPGVITTDQVRPDWASKLANARAHAARRSAAATALHTAAYLMGGSGQADQRVFTPFGRRHVLRRQTVEGGGSSSATPDTLALLVERHQARQQEAANAGDTSSSSFLPPPRGSSSRRNRMEELEDIMMMEAIRLSLAAEDDRRKKEDKEARKEAKKREKENKKAEKAGRKTAALAINSNIGHTGPDSNPSSPLVRVESASSSVFDDDAGAAGKGKAVDRAGAAPSMDPSPSNPPGLSSPSGPASGSSHDSLSPFPSLASEPARPSHLRQMSNASSSTSSMMDPVSSGSAMTRSDTPPDGGADMEPMFNFRSLAAMIGSKDEEQEREKKSKGSRDDSAPSRGSEVIPHSRHVDVDQTTSIQTSSPCHSHDSKSGSL